ncbi:hypothetical protein [Moorena sp. SIO3I6]|uniref:hypothetical protein n=1 Tax=Moorena sp. SIO3I6 TaxID=2607831 RepID=UPI0013F87310|nr:hypothetical protein [Moorena sp. SIO3I6]NEP26264.1 hypothetical protein [Moorena sp. SIO3I6]
MRSHLSGGQIVRIYDEIAFGIVFAHPTPTECDRTLVVWWANGLGFLMKLPSV